MVGLPLCPFVLLFPHPFEMGSRIICAHMRRYRIRTRVLSIYQGRIQGTGYLSHQISRYHAPITSGTMRITRLSSDTSWVVPERGKPFPMFCLNIVNSISGYAALFLHNTLPGHDCGKICVVVCSR